VWFVAVADLGRIGVPPAGSRPRPYPSVDRGIGETFLVWPGVAYDPGWCPTRSSAVSASDSFNMGTRPGGLAREEAMLVAGLCGNGRGGRGR